MKQEQLAINYQYKTMKEIARWARRTMRRNGLRGWKFFYYEDMKPMGVCSHRNRSIGISAPLLHLIKAEETFDTILHEIAHALIAPENKHNKAWKDKCKEIGCRPMATVKLNKDYFHTEEHHKYYQKNRNIKILPIIK